MLHTHSFAYQQNIDACLVADAKGDPENNKTRLAHDKFDTIINELHPHVQTQIAACKKGESPHLSLALSNDDLLELGDIASEFRENFDDVVVLGTGGSSLGSKALYEMSDMAIRRHQENKKTFHIPHIHIITNVDPFSFHALLDGLNLKKTGWVIVSKSGYTVETVMQFLTILPKLKQELGEGAIKNHVVAITEPYDNPLRILATQYNIRVLNHNPDIGGRYSVLSVVGMLPTLIAGLDAERVRDGAKSVLLPMLAGLNLRDFPPAIGAAISVGLYKYHDISSSVMLAYSDRLGSLSRWYRQLWAESLGKEGKGITPIYAMGPVDQHSQLQLWLDGPQDKMFTVMGAPLASGGAPVSVDLLKNNDDIDYLKNRTLGDLMEASRKATMQSLINKGLPVREMSLSCIDEFSVGALMMHFMLETIFSARLLGVNPFDQPAVETGKKLIRQYLNNL